MLIREKDRLALIQIFELCFSTPIRVLAYGSRVNGDAHEGSDLDLVIQSMYGIAIKRNEFDRAINEIQDSMIPILVELRNWSSLPDYFHTEILKKHEILYEYNPTQKSIPL